MKNTTHLEILVLCILTFMSYLCHSSEMKSAKAISTKYSKGIYSANLSEGFHFNKKAPNGIILDGKNILPQNLEDKSIVFQVLPDKFKSAEAHLYVCDDKETVCETHRLHIDSILEKSQQVHLNTNLLDETLRKAKKQNKLVLLRFTAKWCPGCIRYESEVFSQSDYKKISQGYISQKIDVDLYNNFELSEKFKITGIPTVIILNSKGDEITRISDFQEKTAFMKFIDSIKKNPVTAKEVVKNLNTNLSDEEKMSLGRRMLATRNYESAIKFFEKIQPEPFELIASKIQLAHEKFEKNPTQKDIYTNTLKSALKTENQTSRSINWRTELIKILGTKSEEAAKLVAEAQEVAQKLFKNETLLKKSIQSDPPGELIGFEKLAVALELVDLLSEADVEPTQIEAAWKAAAQIGREYKILPKNSGPAKRFLIILVNSKNFEEAHAYALEMLKVDPSNFDIKRRMLKILLNLKKYDESIQLGKEILPKSEGRNEFWVAENIVKAYLASGKKTEAKSLLQQYLAKKEIELPKMKESKKGLEELLKTAMQ